MASKIEFKNRLVRKPFTYKRTIGSSTTKYEPSYGQVIQENMINATNLNQMQDNMISKYDANRSALVSTITSKGEDIDNTADIVTVSEHIENYGSVLRDTGGNIIKHDSVLTFEKGDVLSFRSKQICETPITTTTNYCNIVKFNGKLYCILDNTTTYTTSLYVYDPSDGTWEQISLGTKIRSNYFFLFTATDTYIFFITVDNSYTYITRFDPSDNSMTSLNTAQYIYYGDLCWDRENDRLYMTYPSSSSYTYCRRGSYSDDNGESWTQIGSASGYMTRPRLIAQGGYVYSIGSSYSSDYSKYLQYGNKTTWSYNVFDDYYLYRAVVCEDESYDFWWVFGACDSYTSATSGYTWYVHKWYGGSASYDLDSAELVMSDTCNYFQRTVMLNGQFWSLVDGYLVSSIHEWTSTEF